MQRLSHGLPPYLRTTPCIPPSKSMGPAKRNCCAGHGKGMEARTGESALQARCAT
jgi:hypothetical protein